MADFMLGAAAVSLAFAVAFAVWGNTIRLIPLF